MAELLCIYVLSGSDDNSMGEKTNIVNNNGDILLQVRKRISIEVHIRTKHINMKVSLNVSVDGVLQET
jgi:ApbE superfamily uncharacterized protein (UPF0280 family)